MQLRDLRGQFLANLGAAGRGDFSLIQFNIFGAKTHFETMRVLCSAEILGNDEMERGVRMVEIYYEQKEQQERLLARQKKVAVQSQVKEGNSGLIIGGGILATAAVTLIAIFAFGSSNGGNNNSSTVKSDTSAQSDKK